MVRGGSHLKSSEEDAGLEIDTELAKLTVKTYRTKYSEVAKFWKDLGNGFRKAIHMSLQELNGFRKRKSRRGI